MRLVIRYQVTDGCTFNCTVTQPIEFESQEALLVAFDQAFRKVLIDRDKAIKSNIFLRYDEFEIAGIKFSASTFDIYANSEDLETCYPEIYTLDDWFERYGRG